MTGAILRTTLAEQGRLSRLFSGRAARPPGAALRPPRPRPRGLFEQLEVFPVTFLLQIFFRDESQGG